MTTCKQCSTDFEITDEDRKFYEAIGVSEPTLCPDCRMQRRLAWRNERSMYRRKCDLTGKSMVSFYHPESPYTVYFHEEWWSDKWDPLEYGQDFDFNRPFFEQFDELLKKIPHMSMMITHGENSDYCPYTVRYKNCYMCLSGVVGEDIYYSYWTNDCRDCVDCYACFRCEQCYECIQCINLYNCIFCKDSDNSSDLAFCLNCDGCKNCIGCYGLRHKEYYIFNKKASKEEYEKLYQTICSSPAELQKMLQKFKEHVLRYPQRALQMVNVENCTGDHLLNCRNAHECYLSEGLEDCAYCWNIPQGAKDSQDILYAPKSELAYNCLSSVNAYHCISNVNCWDVKNTFYSFECFYSNGCLGCSGLRQKKYCILNKQYNKEEYEALKAKIIEHMKSTGEWGEFFPIPLSPFAYNETITLDFFPLTEEQVLEKGWKWSHFKPPAPEAEKVIPAQRLPDSTEDIPEDILNWAIECEKDGRLFKLIPQELKFYRQKGLPVPHFCFNCRHLRRHAERNPRKLYNRTCDKCQKSIQTTYSPDRPEKVYCEECYLKFVY